MSVLVFAGPTLGAEEVQALLPCEVRPPARQGDIFRALIDQPEVLVLVDGVFEGVPSVWHHELRAALAQGVAVFGASSMGALRAAELHGLGMRGVGKIFEAYRDGALVDDAEVALLHAGPEHGHRPLTVPLVQVRAAAAEAARRGVLTERRARALVRAAERIHYQSRTWRAVLDAPRLSAAERSAWDDLAKAGLPDPKAEDARACLREVARWMRRPVPARVEDATSSGAGLSALVRARRLRGDVCRWGDAEVPGSAALEFLRQRADAEAVREAGLRRKLLVAFGRAFGVTVDDEAVQAALGGWFEALDVSEQDRPAFLQACGLDAAGAWALASEVAVETRVLALARHLVADGPSDDEALAAEARLSGLWADAVQRLAEGASAPVHDGAPADPGPKPRRRGRR
ncbi:MAG: hypothetical protein RL653_2597 [Pseudomonadota bacterium]